MTHATETGEPQRASVAEAGRLRPSMHGFGALLITLSCLSPGIGVFIVGSDVIRQAGTAALLCFAAAALLGVFMAAVYAELASAFPQPGGEYGILGRALGPGWAFAVLSLNLLGFSAAQALSAMGVATYFAAAAPGLPEAPAAALVVATVTATAVLNIRVNAWVTGAFLAVEIGSLALLAGLGFAHPHRSLVPAVLHPAVWGDAAGLVPVSLALAGAATAGAIYAFNGYGAVVFLGEELHEAPRRIARVVFLSLAAAVVAELGPLAAVLAGAPDLKGLLSDKAPISSFIAAAGGPGISRLMSAAIGLAIFNAMIATALMAGRQLFATGRDRLWPVGISRALARVHARLGSPWVATLVMGATSLAGCLLPEKQLLFLLGNGNVAIYTGLCLATFAGRRSGATAHAGWRMPLFPAPSVLALAALGGVVWFDLNDRDGAIGLAVTAVTVALAFAYWTLFLRRHRAWAQSFDRPEPRAIGD